jgi:hypothetical protein
VTTTPTAGPITSRFGKREAPVKADGTLGSTNHQGTDIGAPVGRAVVAPQAGTVTASTYSSARGYYVVVDHGRYSTLHQHLSVRGAEVGDVVVEGQRIGAVGTSGGVAAHLHTEVHDGTTPIDPEPWYAARGVTLGVARTAGDIHTSPTPASAQEDDMIPLIERTYHELADRTGSLDEVAAWADTARAHGWNAAQFLAAFRACPAENGTVRAAYAYWLDRKPKPADLTFWTRGRTIAQAWAEIGASPEARRKALH